jgi:putative MFS transporter
MFTPHSVARKFTKNNPYLLVLGILFSITAFDTLLLGFAIPELISKYNFSRGEAGLLGTSLMLGVGIGALIFGAISDLIGRKKVIYISVATFSVFTGFLSGLMSLTDIYIQLLILLFVSGLGLGGSLTMTIASLPDLTALYPNNPAKHILDKNMCYLESFWGVGALLLVSSFYLLRDFSVEYLFILGSVPIFSLPLFTTLPDIKQQKSSISGNVLTLLHDYGKITVVVWAIWFCGIYTYYGVFMWLPDVVTSSSYDVVFLIPIYGVQILSPLLLSFIVKEGNTEKLLFIYSLFAGFATLIFILSKDVALATTSMFVISFFSIGGWVLLILLTQKRYPTRIRGLAIGSSASVGRAGGILAPYLTGYFIDLFNTYIIPFAVFAGLFFTMALLSLMAKTIK